MRQTAAVLVMVVATVAAAPQSPPTGPGLAARLQARYERVRDFRAKFSQTYDGGLLQLTTRETGELRLKKPGRLRMEYTSPERKLFVSDGERFYSYFPESRTGGVAPLPDEGQASTAVLFLAGRGDLVRDFEAELAPTPADQPWALVLVPHDPQPDYRSLTLLVDRETLQLRGFAQTDHQGGTTMTRLTDLAENVGLADREFAFSFPAGVTMLDQ